VFHKTTIPLSSKQDMSAKAYSRQRKG